MNGFCKLVGPFLGSLALAQVSATKADVVSCDAVQDMAEVHYGPETSVTFTSSSSSTYRYCSFSINGYVADTQASEEFKGLASKAHFQWTEFTKAQKPEIEAVKLLPYLLFAADPKLDEMQFKQAVEVVDKEAEGLLGCYNDFFAGKEELVQEFGNGNLVCKVTGNSLRTVFTSGDVVRTVLMQRA